MLKSTMRRDIILCVDDEPIVVRACTTAITMAGFRSATAENGAAGLESFMELKDEVCLVLSDVILPVMNGLDMVERILRVKPELKILLIAKA
jgi:DNA-binding NtrC family response regulator